MSLVKMNKSGVTHVTRMTVSVNNSSCNINNNNINKIINNHNNKNMTMNLHSNKRQHFDIITTTTMPTTTAAAKTQPNASPPDFDFNLPCRYFKSSFARSLSLNNANSSNSNNYCRSLDYEQRGGNKNVVTSKNQQCPPLPQRSSRALTPVAAATIDNPNDGSSNSYRNCNGHKNEANNDAANNNNNNNSKRPPAIPARRLPAAANNLEMLQRQPPQQQQQQQHVPLTQFSPTTIGISHAASSAHFNKIINQQQHVGSITNNHNSNGISSSNNQNNNNTSGGSSSNRRNCVWPRDSIAGEQDCELSDVDDVDDDDDDDADIQAELTQISSNDYDQQQQQQHNHQRPTFDLHHEDTVNVEAVLLQNQVDTLQWQLKQVETSCEMYRAVMEEVARFLDRYHSQRQQQLQNRNSTEQISRSKSMYHVYGGGVGAERGETLSHEINMNCSDEAPATYLRARSSTNLVDSKQLPTATRTLGHKITKLGKGSIDDQLYDVMEPANNYTAFKDFTWRRSPKKVSDSKILCTAAATEEKLNQEAFRLSRTIHNLLNTSTQQPDLTQHRNSLAGISMTRLSKTPATASIMSLHQPLHNSTSITIASTNGLTNSALNTSAIVTATNKSNNLANVNSAEMLFLRSLNMRDSRLSQRSSTDSSVHSTSSSSKVETDEEHYHHLPHLPTASAKHSAPKPIPQLGSTTEDESGFSSISSFQDIGVPLCSTMISQNSGGAEAAKVDESLDNAIISTSETHNSFVALEFQVDIRNSTLKAPPLPPTPSPATQMSSPQDANNVVGVPLKATHDMQHRWDTPSKTYRNMPSKFQQRFSALSNDDTATVLWV